MGQPILCLVEDDRKLAAIMAEYLQKHGFATIGATHGDQAERVILERRPDAVILDVMLPGLDGFSICRRIRGLYPGPILFLTARDSRRDEVSAFEAGADDFVRKPADPEILVARIRALLRRGGRRQHFIDLGPLQIDPQTRGVCLDGAHVALTTAEFDLLFYLSQRAGKIVTREALHLALRGVPYDGLDRSIDLRVSRIRKKLGDDKRDPPMIKSIRGSGYLLAVRP